MTTRVFDLSRQPRALLARPRPLLPEAQRRRGARDLGAAALLAVLLVPLAGAAERPAGFVFAGVAAAAILALGWLCGARVRWDWLTFIAAGLGFALPRGPWPAIGPGLFVATVLCGFLWFRQPPDKRRRTGDRPQPGSRERAAQIVLGLSGERHVGQVLAAALPQEYVLINGLTLPRGAGDIDHLVVGPTGVFLLETKTMAGHIVCAPDGSWHRTRIGRAGTHYEAYIGNPANQVQRNIFAVRQVLRKHLPAAMTAGVWIEGLVVFAHPRTELETHNSRIPAVLLDQTAQRICAHVPRRCLLPEEVNSIIAGLLDEAATDQRFATRNTAQAMIELAVLLPVVLALAFSTVAISRLVQAHSAVVAVAHEAARAGALAGNPSEATVRIQTRAAAITAATGLDPRLIVLQWDLSHFAQNPGTIEVRASYPVQLSDIPVVGGLVAPVVTADHVEWVDPFRSGVKVQLGQSP